VETSTNHARIGKRDFPVVRLKLRAWLVLEELHTKVIDAAEEGHRDEFVSSMYSYVSTAFSIPVEELPQYFWADIARAYIAFSYANTPNLNLPLIKPRPEKRKPMVTQREGWEYPGRSWYFWANIFAKSYGWSMEYIAEMDVDDALSLLQEIRVDEQLDKEWEWSLSEIAFSYDQSTKKSKFIPLVRPDWMKATAKVQDLPSVRMRKSEIPVGIVLRWDDGKTSRPQ
jgi:hypothetical protein